MKDNLLERRRFIRIETPLRIFVDSGNIKFEAITKNVSPVGLRCETKHELKKDARLEILMHLPSCDNPIKLKGNVIWQNKVTLEDNAPYDVGIEIIEIEEKDKNPFLKYLCDSLYGSDYKVRD